MISMLNDLQRQAKIRVEPAFSQDRVGRPGSLVGAGDVLGDISARIRSDAR